MLAASDSAAIAADPRPRLRAQTKVLRRINGFVKNVVVNIIVSSVVVRVSTGRLGAGSKIYAKSKTGH